MTYWLGSSFFLDDFELRRTSDRVKVPLTKTELRILQVYVSSAAESPKRPIETQELLDAVWGGKSSKQNLYSHTDNLRRKLREYGNGEDILPEGQGRIVCKIRQNGDDSGADDDLSAPFVATGQITNDNCPYPGGPYDHNFSNVFFGRDSAIKRLKLALTRLKPVLLVCGPSGAGKTSLLTAGLSGALQAPNFRFIPPIRPGIGGDLISQMSGIPESENGVAAAIRMMEAGHGEHHVFCFDQMEEIFREGPSRAMADDFLQQLQDVIGQCHARKIGVSVILAFRKEYLDEVETCVDAYFPGKWEKETLSRLSFHEARRCFVGPARRKNIGFDSALVSDLIDAIESVDGVVDPKDIQKICRRIWLDAAKLATARKIGGPSEIDVKLLRTLMLMKGNDTPLPAPDEEIAHQFAKQVLSDSLRDSLESIAGQSRASEEYLLLCLMRDFVDEDQNRLRKELSDDGFVGQLPLEIVRQLENEALIRRCGENEFELAHDTLADEIAARAETSEAVFAVRSLDRERQRGVAEFGSNPELVRRIEQVRRAKRAFDGNEAEHILRCCLGGRWDLFGQENSRLIGHWARLAAGVVPDQAPRWGKASAAGSPQRLARTIAEAMRSGREPVEMDALELLQDPEIKELVSDEIVTLAAEIQQLALNDPSEDVRARACAVIVRLGDEESVKRLADAFRDPNQHEKGQFALALTRDAIERDNSRPRFWTRLWRSLHPGDRILICWELGWWRFSQYRAASLFILIAVLAFTSVGASLPFFFLAGRRMSLTLPPGGNPILGGLQGTVGAVVWALGVVVSILFFSQICKGRPLGAARTHSVGMSLFAALGGGVSGWINAEIISHVFRVDALEQAGWIPPAGGGDIGRSQIWATGHGWAVVVFGAALGVTGWNLYRILTGKKPWFDREGIERGNFRGSMIRIAERVSAHSLASVVVLVVASLIVLRLLNLQDGICDPSFHTMHAGQEGHAMADGVVMPVGCIHDGRLLPEYRLPSVTARVAGLAVIMFIGSLFLEAGFLFGLLVVQFGVDLTKRLKDPRFLAVHE